MAQGAGSSDQKRHGPAERGLPIYDAVIGLVSGYTGKGRCDIFKVRGGRQTRRNSGKHT